MLFMVVAIHIHGSLIVPSFEMLAWPEQAMRLVQADIVRPSVERREALPAPAVRLF
jgi:hypothetical protein